MNRRDAAHRALDRAIDEALINAIHELHSIIRGLDDKSERDKGIIVGLQRSVRLLKHIHDDKTRQ